MVDRVPVVDTTFPKSVLGYVSRPGFSFQEVRKIIENFQTANLVRSVVKVDAKPISTKVWLSPLDSPCLATATRSFPSLSLLYLDQWNRFRTFHQSLQEPLKFQRLRQTTWRSVTVRKHPQSLDHRSYLFVAKTRITDGNQRSRIRVFRKASEFLILFFFFFFSAAIDCAKTKSEKLTASRVLAAFFPILSYLDHVRSNNHARLFSYPRSYFYTYVNIHICRYRIYVATPVPQRVKSTFYFDVAKRLRHSLEAISSNRPIILFLPVRTCFDIPPELLILFHVPARIRPHENLRCSRNFCVTEKSKKRTYVTRHTENKNRNLYSFSSTRRRFFEVSKWKYIIGTYWNNKCECVTLAGIIFHIVNIISSRGNKWSERARDLGALFI